MVFKQRVLIDFDSFSHHILTVKCFLIFPADYRKETCSGSETRGEAEAGA